MSRRSVGKRAGCSIKDVAPTAVGQRKRAVALIVDLGLLHMTYTNDLLVDVMLVRQLLIDASKLACGWCGDRLVVIACSRPSFAR